MSSNPSSPTVTKPMSKKTIYVVLGLTLIGMFTLSYFFFSDCAICNLDDPEENQYTFTDIPVATAYSMIVNATNGSGELEDLVILDVRTQDEYDAGHLINAMLFPLSEIEDNIALIIQYQNTTIIVHCRSGSRSRMASEILMQYNFTQVFNMLGGFNDWVGAGYPSTT